MTATCQSSVAAARWMLSPPVFTPSPFQSVEHLSWLGLFKDLSEGTHKPSPFYHKRTLHKTRKECEHVREKFLQMRQIH